MFINKQPKFIAARCPNCGGKLELDSNFEVAYCADCGTQSIIQNVKKKIQRKSSLDKVFDFVERQQNIKRQDKQEEKRLKLEKTEKIELKRTQKREARKEWWKKNWIKVLIITVVVIILSFIVELTQL